MKSKKISIGDRFDEWEVLSPGPDVIYKSGAIQKTWQCKCSCGEVRVVRASNLSSGLTSSCGCKSKTDLIGERFGNLTVVKKLGYQDKRSVWLCLCDCGNYKSFDRNRLRMTKSCGCLKGQHGVGMKKHRLYRIFNGMKSRCYNPNATGYKNYGGRGITICYEWLSDYFNFYDWAMSSGYEDGLTIDRIDNDLGYSPDNCRWMTRADQNRNKRKKNDAGKVRAV